MKLASQILNALLPFIYLGAIFLYYNIAFRKRKEWEQYSLPILAMVIVLHAAGILLRLLALDMFPLTTLFDSFSFLAFFMVVVYLIIEQSTGNKSTGIFVLLFPFAFKTISAFNFQWQTETNEMLANPTWAIHAASTIAGYTALSVGAIYSILYLYQHRKMKRKQLGLFSMQLPPLTYLERMSIRSVAIGILFLGIGIVLGHIQTLRILGHFFIFDPKVI